MAQQTIQTTDTLNAGRVKINENFEELYFKADVYNVKAYGAKGDLKSVNDGGITSGTNLLNSATAGFVSSDVGKTVEIPGAGTAGAVLVTTITATNSATQVVVAVNASTTVTNKRIWWGTDDTAAIRAAKDAAFNNLGGTVFFPNGGYLVAGALVTSDANGLNPNAQIEIQAPPVDATNFVNDSRTIRFVGEGGFGIYGNTTVTPGSYIKSTLNQGSGTRPSVIGGTGQTVNNYINKMNYIKFSIENLAILVSSNGGVTAPNMIAVNGLDFGQLSATSVSIATDCFAYANTTTPLGTGSAGIITGRKDNNGPNTLKDVWVSGAFEHGVVAGEHTEFNNTYTNGTYNSLTVLNGNFFVVGKFTSNFFVNGINFPNATLYGEAAGTSWVNLQWDFETSGIGSPPAWLSFNKFINDSNKYGRGTIKYNSQDGIEYGDLIADNLTDGDYGLYCSPFQRQSPKFVRIGNTGPITRTFGSGVAYGDNNSILEVGGTEVAQAANYYGLIRASANQSISNGVVGSHDFVNTAIAGNDKIMWQTSVSNNGSTAEAVRDDYVRGNNSIGTWVSRITSLLFDIKLPLKIPTYTVTGVPSATGIAGTMIYVSNESGGAVIAFSDGTNWRRVTDRAIIS